VLRYDPVAIAAQYRQTTKVLGRILTVLWPLLIFGLRLWWDRQRGRVVENQQRRAIQLRELLSLDPYIKIGQALSPDRIFPLPGRTDSTARPVATLPNGRYQFIEEELGDHPEQIYAELSPSHCSRLPRAGIQGKAKTGETVAIKCSALTRAASVDLYVLRQLLPGQTKILSECVVT